MMPKCIRDHGPIHSLKTSEPATVLQDALATGGPRDQDPRGLIHQKENPLKV